MLEQAWSQLKSGSNIFSSMKETTHMLEKARPQFKQLISSGKILEACNKHKYRLIVASISIGETQVMEQRVCVTRPNIIVS